MVLDGHPGCRGTLWRPAVLRRRGVAWGPGCRALGSSSRTLQSGILTLKLLNLLQHGLIRSGRAFLYDNLSKLLSHSQFLDGVVAVVPQVWVLPWKHVLGHVCQGRIEVGAGFPGWSYPLSTSASRFLLRWLPVWI